MQPLWTRPTHIQARNGAKYPKAVAKITDDADVDRHLFPDAQPGDPADVDTVAVGIFGVMVVVAGLADELGANDDVLDDGAAGVVVEPEDGVSATGVSLALLHAASKAALTHAATIAIPRSQLGSERIRTPDGECGINVLEAVPREEALNTRRPFLTVKSAAMDGKYTVLTTDGC